MSSTKKVALLFISLNQNYWPYVKNVLRDCDSYFLTNRQQDYKVDYFVWSDMPATDLPKATVFETAGAPWPHPTLMRYHLFLQQEEKLKGYDYIFYLDADMKIVAPIGDEIMGEGLTMAEHPMYALARKYIPPYEPNSDSEAYIPRLGRLETDNQKMWFRPLYAAGGFQGGRSAIFIEAMKDMRRAIDDDIVKNYIAIWNDESHWNKYLYKYAMIDKKPMVVLSPSYIYPDSLIKEYYEPLWGKSYQPKIITLTKPFTLQKVNAADLGLITPLQNTAPVPFTCLSCGDIITWPGVQIDKIVTCNGRGNPHEAEGKKIS